MEGNYTMGMDCLCCGKWYSTDHCKPLTMCPQCTMNTMSLLKTQLEDAREAATFFYTKCDKIYRLQNIGRWRWLEQMCTDTNY